jgi:hypothetical protein
MCSIHTRNFTYVHIHLYVIGYVCWDLSTWNLSGNHISVHHNHGHRRQYQDWRAIIWAIDAMSVANRWRWWQRYGILGENGKRWAVTREEGTCVLAPLDPKSDPTKHTMVCIAWKFYSMGALHVWNIHHIKFHRQCVCTILVSFDPQAIACADPFYVKPTPSALGDIGGSSVIQNFTLPSGKASFTQDMFLYIQHHILQYIISTYAVFVYIYIYIYVLVQ